MMHEYECIWCHKREWHYSDDCTGIHEEYCTECLMQQLMQQDEESE